MSFDFYAPMDSEHIKKERNKARELRKTQWWKQKLSQGICHYCEGKFQPGELTMDHIVPVGRGGRSTKGNLAVSCKECNNKKKAQSPVEILLHQLKS